MKTKNNPPGPHRQNLRLPNYNYSWPGLYFVTVCSKKHKPTFGTVIKNQVFLTGTGRIVEYCWRKISNHWPEVELDQYIIMPNHIHGIIAIKDDQSSRRPLLGTIVGSFKSASTRLINKQLGKPGEPVWQPNYYEHVIRRHESLDRIRQYIVNNPLNWAADPHNHQKNNW